MNHLSPEEIAQLVDHEAEPHQAAHLGECAECAAEVEWARRTTEALGQLPDLRPPRGDWAALEARLTSEGLVSRDQGIRSTLARTPGWMRAAAAVVLFVSGVAVGTGVDVPLRAAPAGAGAAVAVEGAAARIEAAEPTTVAEAARAMQQAEQLYVDALVRYRWMVALADEGDAGSTDPQRRYAALEYFLAAGEAAVREAPADPFMNGLLASVRAERQAARALALRSVSRTQEWY